MSTRDDLSRAIETVLAMFAITNGLNALTSQSPGAIAGNPGQLNQRGDLGAVEHLYSALRFIQEPTSVDHEGTPLVILAGKTMTVAKALLVQQPLVARELSYQVARHILGCDTRIPVASDAGIFNPVYQNLDVQHKCLLFECFSILSSSACFKQDWLQALTWFEETQALYQNEWLTEKTGIVYDWEHFRDTNPLCAIKLIEGLAVTRTVLKLLQNTGAYHHRMIVAHRFIKEFPNGGPLVEEGLIPSQAKLLEVRKEELDALLNFRHPDPQTTFNHVLMDPRLQASGAWKRLSVKPNEDMGRRSFSSAFIRKGYLYIAGGFPKSDREDRETPEPQDVWRLQLEPLGDWQLFSKSPSKTNDSLSMNIKIYNEKGYLFTGHPNLDILDLETGKWSKLQTTYQPTAADRAAGIDTEWPWSYKGKTLALGTAQQIIEGRLLVFGGTHVKCIIGCNLLMELNLKTLRWRRLSGYLTVQQNNDPTIPGPRSVAASWVDGKRFFIMYGICEKARPGFGLNSRIGPPEQWAWDDMWSWDIEQEKWRRERIAGNPPAPRYEMGCAYNEKLKRIIIFGGHNPSCYYRIKGANAIFASTIYADTFMLSMLGEPGHEVPDRGAITAGSQDGRQPGPYSWKQVMTCGFPTYRCGSALVCDPDTGKIYMYGGRARAEFVPNRTRTEIQAIKHGKYPTPQLRTLAERPGGAGVLSDMAETMVYRHFGHVWQLHVDIPGGHFECIDKEDEIRTAPPGPWNRCFECGKADFWKQCGGTCGGKAHFCSRECQVKGWKLHKQMHGCKKS